MAQQNEAEKHIFYQRSWLDGCFDFMHFGHANAILQAKITSNKVSFSKYKYPLEVYETQELKQETTFFTPETLSAFRDENSTCPLPRNGIWVGLHSDFEILQHKGSLPVMTLLERCYHVSYIRWVAERGVVQNVPYVTDLNIGVNDAYCEFVLHGDDLVCDANGQDCYYNVRKENRFLIVKRTEGVSTTEIIQRILTENYRERDNVKDFTDFLQNKEDIKLCERLASCQNGVSPYCWVFNRNLDNVLVEGGWRFGSEENVVLYKTDRMFDMLHAGDLEVLLSVKRKYVNCRLVVGLSIGNEDCVNNFRERLFSLVSCSLVDGVVLNPENSIVENEKRIKFSVTDDSDLDLQMLQFRYLTADVIKERIRNQRLLYEERNRKKLSL